MGLSSDQRAQLVEMYQRNAPIEEIRKKLGLSRAGVYYLLQREGVVPTRKSAVVTRIPANADARCVERITELEAENAGLRERLRIIRQAATE